MRLKMSLFLKNKIKNCFVYKRMRLKIVLFIKNKIKMFWSKNKLHI